MKVSPYILSRGNWISMAEFMELALYDEKAGYYSRNIKDIGYRGDFSTSATLCDLPARRIVAQWRESCKACGCRLPIIEIGGGNGDMAVAIRSAFNWKEKLFARHLMVDKSPALRKWQRLVVGSAVSAAAQRRSPLARSMLRPASDMNIGAASSAVTGSKGCQSSSISATAEGGRNMFG